MKLMVSTMLSAAIKIKEAGSIASSLVHHLLRQCLPVVDKICGTATDFVLFVSM